MSDLECSEVRDVFQRGRLPAGGELEAHIGSCQRCEALLAGDGGLGLSLGTLPRPSAAELSDLRAAVLEHSRREVGPRAWLRGRSRAQRLGFSLAVVLLLALVVLLGNHRPDIWTGAPLIVWGGVAAYLTALTLGTSELMARPGRELRPFGRLSLSSGLVLLALCVTVLGGASLVHADATPIALPRHPWGCFAYGSVFAGLLLIWLRLLDRGDRVSLSVTLLSATAAGLMGNLATHLHCASTEPLHLLLGHFAVLPAWGLAYALVATCMRAAKVN